MSCMRCCVSWRRGKYDGLGALAFCFDPDGDCSALSSAGQKQYAPWLLALVRLLVPVNFGASSLSVMNAVPARTQTVQANTVPLSGSAKYVLDSEGVPPAFGGLRQ